VQHFLHAHEAHAVLLNRLPHYLFLLLSTEALDTQQLQVVRSFMRFHSLYFVHCYLRVWVQ
jgi:hypothetical protein